MLKLTFGIITLSADFFLKQVLESIYPFAHKIIIADGAVTWWAENGVTRSMDDTIKIIEEFPDPDLKIQLVKGGPYTEKDDQCRAWFAHVPKDTDYVICNDADEVHSPDNLEKLIRFLEKEQPTSVGFKSDSFFGGFDRIIGGFERDYSFKRVLQYKKGCWYLTHRQPTLAIYNQHDQQDNRPYVIAGKDITGNQLYEATGITMWHGSYVSPKGVFNKIRYYEGAVIAKGQCIPDYFKEVWLPWVQSRRAQQTSLNPHDINNRWKLIEQQWKGVQEFVPSARGECYTELYTGVHPPAIQAAMPELLAKFDQELKLFL